MERECALRPVDLTGIHINLDDHTIEFEDRHGTVGRLLFTHAAVLYEGPPLFVSREADPACGANPTAAVAAPEEVAEGR